MIDVISLHQPWAQWVSVGLKPIETRLHEKFRGLVGKRIAIHAAAHWDHDAFHSAARYLPLSLFFVRKCTPAIIGTVFVRRHGPCFEYDSPQALIDCGNVQRFGLFLESPRLCKPIPCPGHQGIWKYKGEIDGANVLH